MLFEVLAVLCAGLFAGAAAYVSFVEHPARLQCGTAIALAQFGPSYKRGTVMQASLAVLGFAAAVGAWLLGRGLPALVGGIILGAVVPFTLIVIFPTNQRLLDPSLDRASIEAGTLLARWGRLHMVRTVAGGLSFALILFDAARALR